MRGDGRILTRGKWQWVAYNSGGREIREAAKGRDGKNTADPLVAEKFLRARLKETHTAEVTGIPFVTPTARKISVGELLDGLEADFTLRVRLSAQTRSHLKRARADFAESRAASLTPQKIDAYIEERLASKDSPASINRTLQLVSQGFNLAIRQGTLSRAPFIRKLSEADNARQGFFSEAQIDAVLAELPNDGLRDFVEWLATSGQRKGEASLLKWSMVDATGTELTIPAAICKNKKPRTIVLGDELKPIIERRRAARSIEVNGVTTVSEYIFHRGDGLTMGDFKKSWRTATRKAGCPGKLVHDFRRSRVRLMLAAGVSVPSAMAAVGHRTPSMLFRYAIVDSADLLAAQSKTAAFRKKVVSM